MVSQRYVESAVSQTELSTTRYMQLFGYGVVLVKLFILRVLFQSINNIPIAEQK